VFGLVTIVVGAVAMGTAQQPSQDLPDCSTLDAMHVEMQMNLRASAALVACGRSTGGEEAAELGLTRDPDAGTGLAGGNFDVITGGETAPHVTQSEHQIWANGNTVVIHYNDSGSLAVVPAGYSGISVSTNGGQTYTRLAPSPVSTGHGTNFGDPTVVYNKKFSTWYISDLASGCGGQGIGGWSSTNATTWPAGPCIHSGNSDDRQSMIVDNNPSSTYYGNMYTSWNNFAVGGGALQTARSTDGGLTWGSPVTVNGTFIRDVQIQVAENGSVLLATMNEGGGGLNPRTNVLFRSTDGGQTFSAAISMGASFAAPGDGLSPSNSYFAIVNPIWRHMGWGDLATGGNNVALYAYAAHGASTDTGDIYYVRSTDNGATWGVPVRVDGNAENRTQWMPSVAGGGKYFFISWYDRKNTAGQTDPNDYERWGVISKDGGLTWSAPQRISDMIIRQPTQPDPSIQPHYAGDYMRAFFDGTTFYDGWTDGRIVVSGVNQQDVETQRVRLISPNDFNGDVKTDRTVYRPSNHYWYTSLVGGSSTSTQWGIDGDIDVPADYDGDGKTDIAVFRPSSGQWFIVNSSDFSVRVDTWGTSGDVPVPGDVDGDGKADLGIFRASAGAWYVKKSTGGSLFTAWGIPSDVPMLADFDNDGKADVSVFRPSTGVWYILYSGGGGLTQWWGTSGDIPVIGDYDGDGKTDLGVFRPSSGAWIIKRSKDGSTLVTTWGVAGDIPVSGDQDGDGLSDFIVFRDSNGAWYTQYAVGGGTAALWGTTGDKPAGRQPGT
jgi:hypothetical protein